MKELIERLRNQAKLTRRYCPTTKIPTLEENAANAIENLEAENERLKRALQEWVDGKCISQKYLLMIGNLQSELEQTRQEADCANNLLKLIYRHLREHRGIQEV